MDTPLMSSPSLARHVTTPFMMLRHSYNLGIVGALEHTLVFLGIAFPFLNYLVGYIAFSSTRF